MDTPAGFSPPLLFYFISLSLSGGLIYSFHESWGKYLSNPKGEKKNNPYQRFKPLTPLF